MCLSSLVFVDFRVEDYGTLVAGIAPGTGVVLLSPYQDGIEQITQTLVQSPWVKEIHILSHGRPGSLELGSSTLSLETLDDYAPQLKTWSTSFSTSVYLLLYGCQVAAGDAGTEFVERLSQLTGATVAASATPTGNAELGGDWELEVTTGDVKIPVVFSEEARSAYAGVLEIMPVSLASDDTQGNGNSYFPSLSGNGSYVAFASSADNLVPGDTNGAGDIFVKDINTGEITRVSVAADGTQGNKNSTDASISADGRYVTFGSYADNLVPGDTNGYYDIFMNDRVTGETTLVSVGANGSPVNNASLTPSISGDGRYVAFSSKADNLVPGDTNNEYDVFVYDRVTEKTSRVSIATDGTQGNNLSYHPSISGDGSYVAFSSRANNFVPGDTYIFYDSDGQGSTPVADIFVHDLVTGETTRVSVATDGTQGNNESLIPAISADGRYVAFGSDASNLVPEDKNGYYDIFVHDRETQETTLVSVSSDGTQGNSVAGDVSISGDGRYVAFSSYANNLVPEDTNNVGDTFVHDRQTKTTTLVSLATDGSQGNNGSYGSVISADGKFVTFSSSANNLFSGDTNNASDIFVAPVAPVAQLPVLDGSNLSDQLVGGVLNDSISGYQGNDSIYGEDGNDELWGGEDDDYLYGGKGTDQLFGESGNDTLRGREGSDYLNGGEGSDSLIGSSGEDTLNGGANNDILNGGADEDWFEFSSGSDEFNQTVMGSDRIRDFVSGVDHIILDKTTFTRITSQVGDGFSKTSEFTSVISGGDTSAADIVYNRTTGTLYYNNDGVTPGWGSSGQGGEFAVLSGAPALAASDFTLIA